nr:MAG TPA: hypothetical protein [Caudoviricetes sp.]DAX74202.1 MAG TPA: hypothetical protein [Caudoviricetes sp.]
MDSFRICIRVYDSFVFPLEESGFEILEDYDDHNRSNLFDYFIERSI